MLDLAGKAVEMAQRYGAQQAAAGAYRVRDVQVQWRDGQLEKLVEATTRGLGVDLYVDGRYASVSTSDLRPDALERFLQDAVALTRAISPDPFRKLPDPDLYPSWARDGGVPDLDLELEDPAYEGLSAVHRRELAARLEAAARSVPGAEKILSVTTTVSDDFAESWRVHSNGFSAHKRGTSFWLGAEVSVLDADGRRPEDADYAGSRFRQSLPEPESLGLEASRRCLARLGSQKPASLVTTMVVDHRSAGRLAAYVLGPLSGSALQQKRSFLDGKEGQRIGSDLLEVLDDPLVPRGFGSRLFDSEGIVAKPFPVFEGGVLKHYFIDTYYGRKLDRAPTTGRMSNLKWKLGNRSQAQLLADVGEGILVTSFLGGNSNATTGDFSLGVAGFRIRGGQIGEPLAELNIAGNHLELWQRLTAVGNDPYPYSSMRTPSLVFEGVQFAGS
jgi:PmbA protein